MDDEVRFSLTVTYDFRNLHYFIICSYSLNSDHATPRIVSDGSFNPPSVLHSPESNLTLPHAVIALSSISLTDASWEL